MDRFRIGLLGRLSGMVVLVMAGCAEQTRSTRVSDATTPQDKAHQEQLAQMQQEDGEAATAPAPEPATSKRPTDRRRGGQRVIDQPVRR
ncbi:MAG: hypothetical protein GY778_28135 [bacterium]|nr:hypothetical protein [bacterium]